MSDWIRKSNLLNKVAGVHYDTEHPLESYASLVSLINNAETEDPIGNRWKDLGLGLYECSVCKGRLMHGGIRTGRFRFCPLCGSRMEGVNETD